MELKAVMMNHHEEHEGLTNVECGARNSEFSNYVNFVVDGVVLKEC